MNKQDSGVEVVRGSLTEGGDSILGTFFCEVTRQVTSFLASCMIELRESHDLPEYAHYIQGMSSLRSLILFI